jgi:hypothetical protein
LRVGAVWENAAGAVQDFYYKRIGSAAQFAKWISLDWTF